MPEVLKEAYVARPALAIDLGGTHCRFAAIALEKGELTFSCQHTLPTHCLAEFPRGLVDGITLWQDHFSIKNIAAIAIGIAAPVEGQGAKAHAVLTNQAQVSVSVAALQECFGVPVVLVNDLIAIAHSALASWEHLSWIPPQQERASHFLSLASAQEPVVVIAPGTGLGFAWITWHEGRPFVHGSEGGHTSAADGGDQAMAAVLEELRARLGHVSYERVLGGDFAFSFLLDCAHREKSHRRKEICSLRDADSQGGSPNFLLAARVIEAAAKGHPCAVRAVELYSLFLGNACGNAVLWSAARGGVVCAGGFFHRMRPVLAWDLFMRGLYQKGRFASYLEKIPIRILEPPADGLLGLQELLRPFLHQL